MPPWRSRQPQRHGHSQSTWFPALPKPPGALSSFAICNPNRRIRAVTGTLRVLAISNQKGGVGKTTTAINLGTALAAVGEKVLILDIDPQGNASTGVGISDEARPITSFDVLSGKSSIAKAAVPTLVPNLSIVPANSDLVGLEAEMMEAGNRPFRLRDAVTALVADQRAGAKEGPVEVLLRVCPHSMKR